MSFVIKEREHVSSASFDALCGTLQISLGAAVLAERKDIVKPGPILAVCKVRVDLTNRSSFTLQQPISLRQLTTASALLDRDLAPPRRLARVKKVARHAYELRGTDELVHRCPWGRRGRPRHGPWGCAAVRSALLGG
eukprot:2349633-Rhodomonas_salina.6